MPRDRERLPRPPWQFIPQKELDALAARGAKGNREAQARLVEAFSGNCIAWADAQIAKHPRSLSVYRSDVLQDANLGFVDAIRRYRRKLGHFPAWAKRNVMLYLRRATRPYLSRSGCRIDDKEWLDFDSPHFQATVAAPDPTVAAPERGPVRLTPHGARHELMHRMRRLTDYEKQVLCMSEGIPVRRASRNAWCLAEANASQPQHPEIIAEVFGVRKTDIVNLIRQAREKVGLESVHRSLTDRRLSSGALSAGAR